MPDSMQLTEDDRNIILNALLHQMDSISAVSRDQSLLGLDSAREKILETYRKVNVASNDLFPVFRTEG